MNAKKLSGLLGHGLTFASCLLVIAGLCASAAAQLDDSWTLKAGGRAVRVNADGSFELPNISAPDQFGEGGPGTSPDFLADEPLRIIGYRLFEGRPEYLYSTPLRLGQNEERLVNPEEITFTDDYQPEMGLDAISLQFPTAALSVGETAQATVTGFALGNAVSDATATSTGTTYRLSNDVVATIDANGLLAARAPGRVLVTATNSGATATRLLSVGSSTISTTVQGFLFDADGNPLAGVTVTIQGLGTSGVTDANGRFTISATLPVESTGVTLTIALPGVTITRGPFPVVPGGITDTGVHPTVLRTTVVGKLVDAEGAAVAGAQVVPVGYSPSATTSASGAFSLPLTVPLSVKSISLRITPPGKPALTRGPFTLIAGTTDVGTLTLAGPGDEDPLYPGQITPVGDGPSEIAMGDFNGDGIADLVTANSGSDDVSVLLGDGAGGFTVKEPISVGDQPGAIAVGDFNGDGTLDIATAHVPSNSVFVLLGDGEDGFTVQEPISVGDGPREIAVGDFNRDGFQDLATANFDGDNVSVIFGLGAGGFLVSTFPVGDGPIDIITVGDVNEDGFVDLACALFYERGVVLLLGDELGAFSVSEQIDLAGSQPRFITSIDLNDDGDQDIAAVGPEDDISDRVSVLLGDGAGGFVLQENLITSVKHADITTGDFNGDGNSDLATANRNDDTISLLLGNGSGGLDLQEPLPVGTAPSAITAEDFNGDGGADLATVNISSDNVSVLLSDGTGSLNGQQQLPLRVYLANDQINFGISNLVEELTVSDFNGDRNSDLAMLILNPLAAVSEVSILLGDGTGGFVPDNNIRLINIASSLAAGDFNADGLQDLATGIVRGSIGSVSILLGDGSGGFGVNVVTLPSGLYPSTVKIGDINKDGKLDLITTISSSSSSADVCVLLGDGLGTFSVQQPFELGSSRSATDVVVADFNGDGTPDLAASDRSSDSVYVLLANGEGDFTLQEPLAVGDGPRTIVVGDFNEDGVPDLATGNNILSSVSVLLGDGAGNFSVQLPTTVLTPFIKDIRVADFNRDGSLDLATDGMSVLLGDGNGSFEPERRFMGGGGLSIAVGDFNGDGKPDLVAGPPLFGTYISVLLHL